jgi:hypothetical protein
VHSSSNQALQPLYHVTSSSNQALQSTYHVASSSTQALRSAYHVPSSSNQALRSAYHVPSSSNQAHQSAYHVPSSLSGALRSTGEAVHSANGALWSWVRAAGSPSGEVGSLREALRTSNQGLLSAGAGVHSARWPMGRRGSKAVLYVGVTSPTRGANRRPSTKKSGRFHRSVSSLAPRVRRSVSLRPRRYRARETAQGMAARSEERADRVRQSRLGRCTFR